MSLPLTSGQLVNQFARANEPPDGATFVSVEDEHAASQSVLPLLITASTPRAVETLARRIHGTGQRAELPFVHISGRDLPIGAQALTERCSGLLDAAAGGSVLISDVEEMARIVQDVLLEARETGIRSSHTAAVRLMARTTVSLLD
jgi:DNA-binding NtrC family response regulator